MESDYYLEGGNLVFTAAYHWKRGYCCESGCRHCPFGFANLTKRKKATVSWSGGKDSAFALHKVLASRELEVVNLHTIIDKETRSVGLHGVRESLIEEQSISVGIPLEKIYVSSADGPGGYASALEDFYQRCAKDGISNIVFGDIFLQDLKEYRLNLLKSSGLEAHFPLWGLDTRFLLAEFIRTGYQTKICALDPRLVGQEWLGKVIDERFASALDKGTDACGENGEFHTFVFDGPIFREPVPIVDGNIFEKHYQFQKVDSNGEVATVNSTFLFQKILIDPYGQNCI